jgi:putative addiction module killer protein
MALDACSLWATLLPIVEVRKTALFAAWIDGLRDPRGRARVLARIVRLAAGNPGDSAPVGGGVVELRIDTGPGYRVYFVRRGRELVILLAGGDKGSQRRDIATAKRLAEGL